MMSTKEIFSKNLKKLRKDLGLTQEKFAEKLEIQWRNLVDLESGKYLPRPENIDKICNKLNIPINALFNEIQEEIKDERINKIKYHISRCLLQTKYSKFYSLRQ